MQQDLVKAHSNLEQSRQEAVRCVQAGWGGGSKLSGAGAAAQGSASLHPRRHHTPHRAGQRTLGRMWQVHRHGQRSGATRPAAQPPSSRWPPPAKHTRPACVARCRFKHDASAAETSLVSLKQQLTASQQKLNPLNHPSVKQFFGRK